VTDWQVEPCNGLELVRRIRNMEASCNPFIPIMMLTGHTEAWRIARARDAGVNVFAAKPVTPQRLITHFVKMIEDPRPFVKTSNYIGPDRRWKDLGPPEENGERRKRSASMRW
jgi:two-component system chemotaxis response regulator CheY